MVNFVIHDGESNWLQGLMLLVVYFLVAIAFIEHNAETGRGHPVFCCAQPHLRRNAGRGNGLICAPLCLRRDGGVIRR